MSQTQERPTTGATLVPTDVPTLAVVGLGYVGLPTALAYVASGGRVVGYDVSEPRRTAIARNDVDLLPRDLDRLAGLQGDERLVVTGDADRLGEADAVIVCVPTPVDHHLTPDLTALRAACQVVVERARPGQLLVLTSTTYVGTTRDLLDGPLRARGLVPGVDVHVAFSPERIDPANVDFPVEATPRVVGGLTPACTARAADVLRRTAPLVHEVSSPEAAEMTKLHENTFRAVNIAYANEMADVCQRLGLDVTEVIGAAATKPYGFMAFNPGPGVGGHCIPCDPHYLLWQLRADRAEAPVVDAAMRAVAARPGRVVQRAKDVLAEAGRPLAGAQVLVVGVSYKPGVADVRESPALEIIERLRRGGAEVSYADPYVEHVAVDDGVLSSTGQPWRRAWDLVVVHTLHPDEDVHWLAHAGLVLDATYKLPANLGTRV
ncbi:nucleotide sugar dehydrogenase [Nocardioides lianchengensis]|uniref:Nucleotide sugar dehydrogenase n=1 Tax=Nocardioides lianchengensis TaxID=1045774 RepID=A0A1G6PZW9_9ACTN|nr:nucleotide sugar dehydrogenase [Nocardioides lianchengensis]NYG12038.1 nucleotide sugar dehydrogenase [Nocardioides lianchengensis]SDC85511.1 nucleotide sugar dehydrogenase [Nocardioides lianchengensis]